MSAIHEHHRKRLRKKFLEGGIRGLEEHEVLELALFYSKPRANTNDLAHKLINKFGSLRGVCTASENQLLSVDGVGEDTVAFIRFLTEFSLFYRFPCRARPDSFGSIEAIGEFFVKLFECETRESVFAMLFTGNGELISVEQVGDGSSSTSTLPLNKTLKHAVSVGAKAIAIGHCHPVGGPKPSRTDIDLTNEARFLSDRTGIYFIDHFIVSGENYFSIRHGETNMKKTGMPEGGEQNGI